MFGRGAHGSMPQASIDPMVMAAATVLRLQTIVSREVAAADAAVVTIGARSCVRISTLWPRSPGPRSSWDGICSVYRFSPWPWLGRHCASHSRVLAVHFHWRLPIANVPN